jgi:hypothetical protein
MRVDPINHHVAGLPEVAHPDKPGRSRSDREQRPDPQPLAAETLSQRVARGGLDVQISVV